MDEHENGGDADSLIITPAAAERLEEWIYDESDVLVAVIPSFNKGLLSDFELITVEEFNSRKKGKITIDSKNNQWKYEWGEMQINSSTSIEKHYRDAEYGMPVMIINPNDKDADRRYMTLNDFYVQNGHVDTDL